MEMQKGGVGVSIVKFKCDQNLISKMDTCKKTNECRVEGRPVNNPVFSKIPRSLHKNNLHKMFFI